MQAGRVVSGLARTRRADGDEQRAAQELAAMDGIDLNSWAEAIEEEIAEDGARGAS
jgi:hypothetical protein